MGESSQFQLLLQYATRKEIVGGDAVQVGGDNLCCRESVVHGQQVARVHDETFAVLQCGGSGVRDDDIGLIGGCNLGSTDDFLFFSIDGIEFCFL